MDTIGAEVGQKMRSAIKAKLMELGCYVDDELPDYIMVMVANKRTKTQMEDDLQLFLRTDTRVFVEWLQQVLKKLKEVTITNPEVCSSFKELKRKATMEIVEVAIKKEKKEKRKSNKTSRKVVLVPEVKSLTDDIPVQAQKLVEKRIQNNRIFDHIEIKSETSNTKSTINATIVNEDNFDIPSLAEVNDLEDSQLDIVENKIKEARSRIVLMETDSEDDDDFLNIRADAEELSGSELDNTKDNGKTSKSITTDTRRILNLKRLNSSNKNNISKQAVKLPMSERLGSRPNQNSEVQSSKASTRKKISLTETLREEQILSGRIRSTIQSIISKPVETTVEKKKESVHKRLGLPSAVIPLHKTKRTESPEEKQQLSVMSVVKVKPRKILPGKCQANKSLLLKAVAEAQKSIAQTPVVGKGKKEMESSREGLFTKNYREKLKAENKSQQNNKKRNDKLKNIIIQIKSNKDKTNTKQTDTTLDILEYESDEYIPQKEKLDLESSTDENDDNIPNAIDYEEELQDFNESNETEKNGDEMIENYDKVNETTDKKETKATNHQFIVTLDGLKDKKFIKSTNLPLEPLETIEKTITVKKAPSPIIFTKEKISKPEKNRAAIPEKLPKVQIPISVKAKERCKYWPQCRLKELCEFVHPNSLCKVFPMCKFGEKCLYIHPKCKFDASCSRKDCLYSHVVVKIPSKIGIAPRPVSSYHSATTPEICKYFPNCSNPHCVFFHPKPCRFGQFCLNKTECNFSHGKIPNKEKLTWHSNAR